MQLSDLFVQTVLWSIALAKSNCQHDPSTGWSQVDCETIQIPYAPNSLIPPDPGDFTPPVSLPGAPTTSNSTKREQYHDQLKATLKGTTGANAKTSCNQCVSSFNTLRQAAHDIPPSDITTLLEELCSDGFALFASGTCTGKESIYSGSQSEGPYWAKVLFLLQDSADVEALCYFNQDQGADCPAPPVAQIKESDWFKTAKPSQKAPQQPSKNTFGVVHLSDIHLAGRTDLSSPEVTRWGNHTETTPDMMLSAFSTMKGLINMDDVGFSIFTGDIVDHGSSTSEDYIVYEEKQVFDAFLKEMTSSKGKKIPTYATLGNHDTYPEMVTNSDSSWNFDFLSSLWQNNSWIDSAAAQQVKTHYAAYSIANPPNMPGLKIVSLNTDFWYCDNWFNYPNYSNPDPNGMMKFLISELEDSESKNEKVWIIGHVPSGFAPNNAIANPTALFQSIIVRFSPSTIAATFWGHTHSEQKQIFYDFADDSLKDGLRDTSKLDFNKPLTMGWIGPSIVPNEYPAWSYYEVDRDTYSIVNAKTYWSNHTEGLYHDWEVEPFELEYDARQSFDPKNTSKDAPLDASFWHEHLASVIESDADIAEKYMRYQKRGASTVKACNSTCVKMQKCFIQAATAEIGYGCHEIDPNY